LFLGLNLAIVPNLTFAIFFSFKPIVNS
jgi:hypothetical protein